MPSNPEQNPAVTKKPPAPMSGFIVYPALPLLFDLKLLVARELASRRGHRDKTGGRASGNSCFQKRVGNNCKLGGSSIERDAGRSLKSLPENLGGASDLAGGGDQTDERPQAHIKAVDDTRAVGPSPRCQSVNLAVSMLHGGRFWVCAMFPIEVVEERVGACRGDLENHSVTLGPARTGYTVEVAVGGLDQTRIWAGTVVGIIGVAKVVQHRDSSLRCQLEHNAIVVSTARLRGPVEVA